MSYGKSKNGRSYIAGDIHGALEIEKVLDFIELESCIRTLTEDDYLILLGDVGLCWDDGIKDAFVRKKLEELPLTVLWIDGNHENFDIIDSMPVTSWHGGMVQFIGEKIIHLMRGYVYEINGYKFFTFGGGFSVDKMHRQEGISWWEREMPSEDEYDRGKMQLRLHRNKVDFILTHTAPAHVAGQLVDTIYPGEEELQDYLEEIAQITNFKRWYFGHWHKDCVIDKYVGVYDNIIELPPKASVVEEMTFIDRFANLFVEDDCEWSFSNTQEEDVPDFFCGEFIESTELGGMENGI